MEQEKKCGLVLEGGGLRGMFTGGVLDVFMENDLVFDGTVGVSAGALFGINLKSEQPYRAFRYNIKYKDDRRYMSFYSWITTGNFVNERFSYDTLPNMLDPFDYRKFMNNPMEFYAVCTDIKKGVPVYRKIDIAETNVKWLQASASMPIFSEPVKIGDSYYLDGGMTDSIPLKFMQSNNYQKNVVILTRPMGYRKRPANIGTLLKLWYCRFPKVSKLMQVRHLMYNKQVAYVLEQQKLGNTFVIAPEVDLKIGRVELNEEKMTAIYKEGRSCANKYLNDLRVFLGK